MVQLYREPATHVRRRAAGAPLEAGDWQARAVAAYGGPAGDPAHELARAVLALTGQALSPEQIWSDRAARVATAALGGEHFRWEGGQLALVRPCDHCGTGLIASPPLRAPADLGYALAAWRPRHPGCEDEDEDSADW